ncbi:MAG: HDOD domain-containing protein [Tepidisphaeraceae bacterium]
MILVVDDEAIYREPIAAMLRLAGFEVSEAAGGRAALGALAGSRPDLLLLDANMPDVNGIDVLRRVRSDPRLADLPVIVLSAVKRREIVAACARLGVRDYLLKTQYSTADFLARVRKYVREKGRPIPSPSASAGVNNGAVGADTARGVAPTVDISPSKLDRVTASGEAAQASAPLAPSGRLAPTEVRDATMERMKKATAGRALDGVVSQILSMAASSNGDAAQLAAVISRDPLIAARVLGIANSAAYASRGQSINVIDAVRKIGFSAVRNIASAVGVFGGMPAVHSALFNPTRCWQHSFAVAKLFELFEAERAAPASGSGYLIGLCHDLAELLVYAEFTEEYRAIDEVSRNENRTFADVLGERLGVTHRELLLTAIRAVGLPEEIRVPIELHYQGVRAGDAGAERRAAVLDVIESLANGLCLGLNENAEARCLEQKVLRGLLGRDDFAQLDPEQFRAEVLTMTTVFARLTPAESKSLNMVPPQGGRTVYYVREAGLAALDPVELLVKSGAPVRLVPHFPSAELINDPNSVCVMATKGTVSRYTQSAIGKVLESDLACLSRILWHAVHRDTAAVPVSEQLVLKPRSLSPATMQMLSAA